jgi:phosphoribosylformimino-5-aminoimidazole carboxamide ribotide isomerase
MEAWLDIGVERIVLGTLVLENPKLVEEAAGRFPGRLAASLDSVGEALKVRGWVKDGGQHLLTAAAGLKNLGVSLVVHTDVERDGTSSGPNLSLAGAVASVSGLPTLVAGGVSGPKDLLAIKRLKADSLIVGAISGRALYEGTLSLKEGLSIFGSK